MSLVAKHLKGLEGRARHSARDMQAAAAIVAACEFMQIIPEQGDSLPAMADRVVAAVGCEVAPACSRCGSAFGCSCCARARCGSSSRCDGFGGGFDGGRVSCRKAQVVRASHGERLFFGCTQQSYVPTDLPAADTTYCARTKGQLFARHRRKLWEFIYETVDFLAKK